MRVLESRATPFVFSQRLHESGTDLKLKLQRQRLNITLRFKYFTASNLPEGIHTDTRNFYSRVSFGSADCR